MGTLTKKQIDFSIYYVQTRNIYQSALSAGYSQSFAKSKGHELLKNSLIKEKIANLEETYYKEQFKALAFDSVKNLKDIINDDTNRATQLNAIKYALSMAGVVNENTESGTIEIKVKLPDGL